MGARPIKLLQIVNSLQAGGMENIVVEVCNRLKPEGFSVTVCCLDRLGVFEERLRPEVARVELRKQSGFRWKDVAKLRRLMADGAFDVVHTHHLGGLIYATLARGFSRRPRIVHSEHIILHDWELERRRLWQRRLLYWLACDCVFTLSRQQRDQLLALRLNPPGLFTLPNGVDCTRFRPVADDAEKMALRDTLGLNGSAVWLGTVARFATAKRHGLLVEAFEQVAVAHPEVRLLLVGDGGVEKERVLARIAASPVRERIHWAGLQQDPVPWYQVLDVLVIASESEGMPNAALESLACGVPLVANTACGVAEVADDGEHGWISALPDADRLAGALRAAVEAGDEERRRRGAAGRRHVEEAFSLEVMMGRYEEVYSEKLKD